MEGVGEALEGGALGSVCLGLLLFLPRGWARVVVRRSHRKFICKF